MSFEDEEKFYLDEKTKFVALLNSLGWSEDNLLNQVDKCVGERQTKAAERRGPSLFEVICQIFDAEKTPFLSVQTVQAIIGSGAEGIELAHPTTNIEQFP